MFSSFFKNIKYRNFLTKNIKNVIIRKINAAMLSCIILNVINATTNTNPHEEIEQSGYLKVYKHYDDTKKDMSENRQKSLHGMKPVTFEAKKIEQFDEVTSKYLECFKKTTRFKTPDLSKTCNMGVPRDSSSCFDGLIGLKLKHGFLSRVPPEMWGKLDNVEVLDCNKEDWGKYSEGIKHLVNLKELHAEMTGIRTLDKSIFEKLTKLKFLDISDNYELAKPIDFSNLGGLKHLVMNHCRVLHSSDGFEYLVNLKELSLEGSLITNLKIFDKLGKLRSLNLSRSVLLNFRENDWESLRHLRSLSLKQCFFDRIPRGIGINLTNLRFLDVRSGRIRLLESSDFENLQQLEHLNLSRNHFMNLCEGCLKPLRALKVLKLSNLSLKGIPADIKHLSNLENVDLSANCVGTVDLDAFGDCKNLSELDLSHNHSMSRFIGNWDRFKNLRTLNISLCQFKQLPIEVSGLPNLRNLFALLNFIEVIDFGFFEQLAENRIIEVLDLRQNRISSIPRSILGLRGMNIKILLQGNPIKFEKTEFTVDRQELIEAFGDMIKLDS